MNLWTGMEDCLSSIVECEPSAVLDAGSGSGLWGCLLREYLDISAGRIRPEEWRTRIDAIETDPSRVQQYAHSIYTEILIGDICEVVPRRAAEVRYDVILFGDVIEDLYKDDGRALLEVAAGLVGQLVVIRVRLGDSWLLAGHEEPDRHLSRWCAADFTEQTFAGRGCVLHEYDDSFALVTVGASGGSTRPTGLPG